MLIAANEIIISTRLTTRHDSPGCESRVRHITLPHVAQRQSLWQWQWHWHLLPLTALPLSWGYKPNICVGYTMRDCVCVFVCAINHLTGSFHFRCRQVTVKPRCTGRQTSGGKKKTESKFDLLHVYAQGVWAPRNDAQKYARPFFPCSVCAP